MAYAYPSTFYDLDAGEWYEATGAVKSTGYSVGERVKPVYRRRRDGVVGWFPEIGSRFTPLAEGEAQ